MLTNVENWTFVCSGFLFVATSFIMLTQVCTSGVKWNNVWNEAFVSDQLSACEDNRSFVWIGWLFISSIAIQTCLLMRVWSRHYHVSSACNMTFHLIAFHFVFQIACVNEFRNDKSTTSSLSVLNLDSVPESTWHIYASVQAIVEFCIMHTILIYCLNRSNLREVRSTSYKLYEVVDCIYFIVAIAFFIAWMMNLVAPASILEWSILFLAVILQLFAIHRYTEPYEQLDYLLETSFDSGIIVCIAYCIITIVLTILFAPPSFESAHFFLTDHDSTCTSRPFTDEVGHTCLDFSHGVKCARWHYTTKGIEIQDLDNLPDPREYCCACGYESESLHTSFYFYLIVIPTACYTLFSYQSYKRCANPIKTEISAI